MFKTKKAIELSKEIITSPDRNYDGFDPSTCTLLIAVKAVKFVADGSMPVSDAQQLLELAKYYQ